VRTPARWAVLASTIAVAGVIASACGTPDAVVAEQIPICVAQGGACRTSNDCCSDDGGPGIDGGSTMFFCSKTSCGAEQGSCQPTSCDPNALGTPTCGCSGVWYLNDCLRRQHGEPAAVGELSACPTKPCGFGDGGACPEGSYCGLIEPDCNQPSASIAAQSSACWVLPSPCPSPSTETFGPYQIPPITALSCKTNMCMDLCRALEQQAPIVFPSKSCP
jgi:hypothetical protein